MNGFRIISGLLSGNYPFRVHLHKIGMCDLSCRQSNKEKEIAHLVQMLGFKLQEENNLWTPEMNTRKV